jgi:hypothetical protein
MLPDGRRGRRDLWVENTDHRRHPISASSCSTAPRPYVAVAYWLTTSTSFANPAGGFALGPRSRTVLDEYVLGIQGSSRVDPIRLKRPSKPGLALAQTFGQAT